MMTAAIAVQEFEAKYTLYRNIYFYCGIAALFFLLIAIILSIPIYTIMRNCAVFYYIFFCFCKCFFFAWSQFCIIGIPRKDKLFNKFKCKILFTFR